MHDPPEPLADRSLEDAWTFLESSDAGNARTTVHHNKLDATTIKSKFDVTTASTTGTPVIFTRETTQAQSHQAHTTACDGQIQRPAGAGGDSDSDRAEEYADLAPFVRVWRRERHPKDAAEYDANIDVPLPRCHSEVVRANAAKSAAGRRRAALHLSQVRDVFVRGVYVCVCV